MTLKLGSKGANVKILQSKLNLVADGVFGPITEKAVKEFQSQNGLVADGIVGNLTWAKLNEDESEVTIKKSKRVIREIILHCSDTYPEMKCTVDDIRQWHLARKFNDIGYHYVIYQDGSIHLGRDVDVAGAHCTGHNNISIGICYIGGKCKEKPGYKDTRTPAQKTTINVLLAKLKKLYPKATIHGHNEFAAKACPCFDVKKEYGDY